MTLARFKTLNKTKFRLLCNNANVKEMHALVKK